MTSVKLVISEDLAKVYEINEDQEKPMVECSIGDNQYRSEIYKGYRMTVDMFSIWVRIPNGKAFCFNFNSFGTHILQ